MPIWSHYLTDNAQWHAWGGVRFMEPITERDKNKFKMKKCVFCQKDFYYPGSLPQAPEGCTDCFNARSQKGTPNANLEKGAK